MKHLVIGSLVSFGQYSVTARVVHLPKRTETSLITESDEADLITESDQAVRAVHSCNSWFQPITITKLDKGVTGKVVVKQIKQFSMLS